MESKVEETRLIMKTNESSPLESSNSSGEYIQKISNVDLSAWKAEMEPERDPTGQVPDEKQLTLSWSHINAYGNSPSYSSNEDLFSIIRRNGEPQDKHILKDVSGSAYPGELTVLMGSSGAGKTTLLNCLTYRNLKGLSISGLVCINNSPVTQMELAANSAYVQQDDLFIGYLTVKEHLIFQACVMNSSDKLYEALFVTK